MRKARGAWFRAAAAALLVAGVVGAACSGGGPTGEPAATPTALPAAPEGVSQAPARPSPGCSSHAVVSAGATEQTIGVGGAQRTYRRYVPEATGATPLPVVINLHGLTSNIAQQVAITAFEPLAAAEKFIVLTPQGEGRPTGWSIAPTPDNRDVLFLTAMLDEVETRTCVDTARVYATGISNGGIMSSLLACLAGDRIAAVGLVSGIVHPAGCSPPRAVPMIVFWGKEDVVLPFCGGVGPVIAALLSGSPVAGAGPPTCPPEDDRGFPPVEDVVRAWAETDGCGAAPDIVAAGAHVEERMFSGCRDGAAMRFYIVSDGGHTWPGSKAMQALSNSAAAAIIGHTTDEIDATRLIWSFFKGYALGAP